MDTFEEIKKKHLKQIELIDELKYAQQVERNEITHELKKEEAMYDYYHLIDIKQAKIIKSGPETTIKSYCRIRNIKEQQIKHTGII